MSTTTLPRTTTGRHGLDELVAAIRATLARHSDWDAKAEHVAGAIRSHLPPVSVLSDAERAGSPERAAGHRLHIEPDGSFSVLAIAWRPEQWTRIHDHVTWCVVAVLDGELDEEVLRLGDAGDVLVPDGRRMLQPGATSGDAPPGDIHRLGNPYDRTAVTLHVYGTDVSRLETSTRRTYDLPRITTSSPTGRSST